MKEKDFDTLLSSLLEAIDAEGTEDREPEEMTPEIKTDDVYPEDEHKEKEDVEGVVVEAEEGTKDREPEEMTPEIKTDDVYPADEHKEKEDVEGVVVEDVLEGEADEMKGADEDASSKEAEKGDAPEETKEEPKAEETSEESKSAEEPKKETEEDSETDREVEAAAEEIESVIEELPEKEPKETVQESIFDLIDKINMSLTESLETKDVYCDKTHFPSTDIETIDSGKIELGSHKEDPDTIDSDITFEDVYPSYMHTQLIDIQNAYKTKENLSETLEFIGFLRDTVSILDEEEYLDMTDALDESEIEFLELAISESFDFLDENEDEDFSESLSEYIFEFKPEILSEAIKKSVKHHAGLAGLAGLAGTAAGITRANAWGKIGTRYW